MTPEVIEQSVEVQTYVRRQLEEQRHHQLEETQVLNQRIVQLQEKLQSIERDRSELFDRLQTSQNQVNQLQLDAKSNTASSNTSAGMSEEDIKVFVRAVYEKATEIFVDDTDDGSGTFSVSNILKGIRGILKVVTNEKLESLQQTHHSTA